MSFLAASSKALARMKSEELFEMGYPLDMIQEPALAAYPIVFRVQDPLDQVLGGTVNDEWRWGRLFAIVKRVGVFGP